MINLDDFQSSEISVLMVHDVTSRVATALPLQISVICKHFAQVWTPPLLLQSPKTQIHQILKFQNPHIVFEHV